jgi:hypothetical protein
MLDATAGESAAAPRCTWCSAPLPSDHEATCPSCGATLIGDGDAAVPGLTAIDAEAILRNARAAKSKPRSRLLGWISGEYDEGADAPPPPGSLAPPPEAVRREMLRLELEAQLANAEAETNALTADAAVEEGRPLAVATDAALAATGGVAEGSSEPEPAPDAPEPSDVLPATGEHAEDEAPPA